MVRVEFSEGFRNEMRLLEKQQSVYRRVYALLQNLELSAKPRGVLLDVHVRLYELKAKRPPIRVYYQWRVSSVYVLGYGMKTSAQKQQRVIEKFLSVLRGLRVFVAHFFLCREAFLLVKDTNQVSSVLQHLWETRLLSSDVFRLPSL